DFQDSLDGEEEIRSSHEYLNDSEHTKEFKAKYNKIKSKLSLLNSNASAPSSSLGKSKCLIVESYDWDEKEVSSDDNDVTEVNALMALTDEERISVGKESANNGEWVKISIQKDMYDSWKSRMELYMLNRPGPLWKWKE
nr:retrovirus-related Pol polyprotein from transposon TNT 1-94 [Tanacetum cinerariifolium]